MFSLSKSTKKRVPIASKMQSGRSGERVLIVNVYVSVIVGGGCVLDVVEIEAPPTSYVWDTYPSRSLSPAAVVRLCNCSVLRRVSPGASLAPFTARHRAAFGSPPVV